MRIAQVGKPASYRAVFAAHAPWALASGVLLLLSFFVSYPDTPFRLCGFYRLFSRPCPFCGFSRSFAAMTAGDPAWAFVNSPAAVLLYIVVAIAFVWNLAALVSARHIQRGPWLRLRAGQGKVLLILVVAVLVLNWAYRWGVGLECGS